MRSVFLCDLEGRGCGFHGGRGLKHSLAFFQVVFGLISATVEFPLYGGHLSNRFTFHPHLGLGLSLDLPHLEELHTNAGEHELQEGGDDHDVSDGPDGHEHTLHHVLWTPAHVTNGHHSHSL